jgi:integrase
LRFLVLVAARSNEVIGMRWSEIDLTNDLWTVPGPRMKSGREHTVPLSTAALQILEKLAAVRSSEFVFPGLKEGRPMGAHALAVVLHRLNATATVHGMRSAFRDFAGDETDHARETAEAALAHATGDATEQAYRRGSALEKRRALMEQWGDFCTSGVRKRETRPRKGD